MKIFKIPYRRKRIKVAKRLIKIFNKLADEGSPYAIVDSYIYYKEADYWENKLREYESN